MPKKITTKAAWTQLGFDQFSKGGISALKIEAMARSLGVSKASFYHFFKSRDIFISDIITHWRDIRTEEFIALSKAETSKAPIIETLILAIFSAEIEDDFLFYLRRLSSTHSIALSFLLEIETQRIDFAANAIEHLGYLETDAREKATIVYNYYLGWRERQRTNAEASDGPEEELALLIRQLKLSPQAG